MDVVITIVVVRVFIVLGVLALMFVGTIVMGALDIGIVARLGRDLKKPDTSPERLRQMTREACAVLRDPKTEKEGQQLLGAISRHGRADADLQAWIADLRVALTEPGLSRASNLIASGPPAYSSTAS